MRVRFATAGLLAAACLAGCGGGGPELVPVKGTVKYKGQPLPTGSITFHPAKGRPATGTIKDGAIQDVTTVTAGDGATAGTAKVTVQANSGGGDMYAPRKSLIPDKYGDPEKSGLTAEIKAGGGDLAFDLN